MKKQILIALFIISLNVLFLSETDAEMPGMDGNIQRAYAETEFGRVHYWEIGKGPVLILFHQSGQTSSEYLAMGPLLADDYRVIAIDYLIMGNQILLITNSQWMSTQIL